MSPRDRSGDDTMLLIDEVIDNPDRRIVVCCGSGGVGKTTMAASIGVRAAERGRRVVVLTIDPARRLAQALGLESLDNTPRPVSGILAESGGSLDAMMLDMKRTFDEVVEAHSTPEKAAQILANPFYQALSSSFAGTQEYMAMEKLGQLRRESEAEGRWDLIIVDTPPSRSALDFLDAPNRLSSFLDGRFIRLLMAPARIGSKVGMRMLGAGVAIATMTKVLGGDLLTDVQSFVAALDTMFGGFRERADRTYALLKDDETVFVVVAAPEQDAMREASFFVQRLGVDQMPLAGLIVNRMQRVQAPGLNSARALDGAERLESETPSRTARLSASLLRVHAEVAQLAERHLSVVQRFRVGHPGIPVAMVPAAARDVHDLADLREVGAALAGAASGVGVSVRS
ncbi:ArsA family ATPase [Kribbia dieselivorans]|uniref:ArsA family ATPase n=1 Tax=Kribbia dieselivorans TaxID=331526 RepID=UPI000837AA4E|nr:ArsA family ATPase [Kribbia dieselivorans]